MRCRCYARVGLLGCFTLLATSGLTSQSNEVQLAFQRGVEALRGGNTAEAEGDFRTVVRLDPKLPEGFLDLGLVLGREGKLPEAVETIQRAIQLNPTLDSAHMFLGIFEYQTGQMDVAIESLHQELALHPKSAETLSWVGIVELAAGRPERAVGPLDQAAELTPDDLNVLELRGRAHSQVAQSSYARMGRINPNAWQVHKVRAELLASDGRDREAITEYEAALKGQARNPDIYEGIGDSYRHLNELESARKAYQQELELAPRNVIAMYNLGSTEIELGDHGPGVPLLEEVLKVYVSSPKAEYYLGRGLADGGRDAEASALLEKAAREDPSGEAGKRSLYELARIYRRLHKTEDAQRALAGYTHLRDLDDKQKSSAEADWRKLSPSAAAQMPNSRGPGELMR